MGDIWFGFGFVPRTDLDMGRQRGGETAEDPCDAGAYLSMALK